MSRSAGLLVHPTSLPGSFGIGDLGPEASRFLDWAASAGQSVWQILPLGPTGDGGSPYDTLSAFAGNPLLISPRAMKDAGWTGRIPEAAEKASRVSFASVRTAKGRFLRETWQEVRRSGLRQDEVEAWAEGMLPRRWLDDWTLFIALKEAHGQRSWIEWDEALVRRDPSALERARQELREEIEFHRWVQFVFFEQWASVRSAAGERGIRIFGDVPIYVAFDSADVWAHQELFDLTPDGSPRVVAGVPPDYFSETGQRWGNPLYRWDRLQADGFRWWIDRFRINLHLVDLVRVDHFRGFAGYWEIPASEPTAVHGRWVDAPGTALFEAVRRELGSLPLVAEDLGTITPDVDELRDRFELPGMKVMQFGFGDLDNIHLPHHYIPGMVGYTATHDNDTTAGWFRQLDEESRRRVIDYTGLDPERDEVPWPLIRSLYESVADLVIIPLQDAFSVGSEARMNTPGEIHGNWAWRARSEQFAPAIASRLRRLGELTGRLTSEPSSS